MPEGIDAGGTAICTDEPTGITWLHQLEIKLEGHGQNDVVGVPVPIRFSSAEFAQYQLPKDPKSLRFVGPSQVLLHHEVEAWSAQSGALVWILATRFPDEGTRQRVDMYYGDEELASIEAPQDVWTEAGYSAVFHFQNDSGLFFNSADPAAPGVALAAGIGAAAINDGDALGHALQFPGEPGSVIELPHSANQQSDEALGDVSVEVRFKPTGVVGGERVLVDKPGAYSMRSSANAANSSTQARLVLDGGEEISIEAAPLSANLWALTVLNVDTSSSRRFNYSINGEPAGTTLSFEGGRGVSAQPLTIGGSFQGLIDELRISSLVHAGSWNRLQAALLNDDGLQSFGAHLSCNP